MSSKRCSGCGEEKPLEEFHRNRRHKDGRASQCKLCRYIHYGAKARERAAAWVKANPEAHIEHGREYRVRNPEKARAHWILTNSVREGKIFKPDACEDCGQQCKKPDLHGHHHDYSEPLQVEWLCQNCHTASHFPQAALAT